ncbi:acetoacetate decarboxylase family protein [Actinomadura sp. DC4]|uniref:acetoacetate decarboxylase family protein n=1 Tax=Actinomadura sp. DC4 TaxID=3055069 RepID=UPI0025AFA2A6|nr:acetoacetate decarboxylase family protein [Actinomadura sp. DC4]MDN3357580.1 acetoacetate decarboxylase family protein [Actinomadura sp. DC4]
MSRTRWVREPTAGTGLTNSVPPLPALEVVYLTDPETLAEVLPPPLSAPPEPRVHVRITDIDLTFGEYRHKELVGYFAVDAVLDGEPGEYPLLIPIDMEPAIAVSRERFGEPKKLAEISLDRYGDRVAGRVTRQGVTFIEITGRVAGTLPTPEPYPARQFWFKFMPAAEGPGFDGDPLLVRLEQTRRPESVERVEGELTLRELASCPVVDLPVRETVSIQWVRRSSENTPKVVGPVDPVAFAPFAAARYH